MRLKKSPPWITYYNEINELFCKDPDINVVYDEDKNEIKLYVEKERKATSLELKLPSVKKFGNVELKITVVPGNNREQSSVEKTPFEIIFEGNPAVSYIERTTGIFQALYIVFENEVVQYFDDNIGDINGLQSTLYQDIARRIFPDADAYFCTDVGLSGKEMIEALLDCADE